MLKFIAAALDLARDLPRLGLSAQFTSNYKSFLSTIRLVWRALLDLDVESAREEVLESGILQRVAEDWLPSQAQIIITTLDAEYNPLLLRSEAVSMLRALLLRRPQAERLVQEAVRWLSSSGAPLRELAAIKSPATKRGAANARKTAADCLAVLAAAGAEVLDDELTAHGALHALLQVSQRLPILHPAVSDAWQRWAARKDKAPEAVIDAEAAAGAFEVEVDAGFDAADAAGGAPLVSKANPLLEQLNEAREKPLSSTSAVVAKKQGQLFERADEMLQSRSSLSEGQKESERAAAATTAAAAAAASRRYKPSEVDVSLVLDRMGHLVLAVKQLFDRSASEAGMVRAQPEATAMLLELGLRGDHLTSATAALDALAEAGTPLLDFPSFLSLYAFYCGLSAPKNNDLLWAPGPGGLWREVGQQSADALLREATPYSSSPSLDGSSSSSAKRAGAYDDVWVQTEDVGDIVALTGLNVKDHAVADAIRALRSNLPGLSGGAGKLCFQELLALYKYLQDAPPKNLLGSSSLSSSAAGAGAGGRGERGATRSFRPVHGSEAFNRGVDESELRPSSTKGARLGSSAPASSTGGYALPFRATAPQIPPSQRSKDFRRLDVTGEGRLTFLTLKSALELRDVHVDDTTVRRWLQESDRGAKGYVDFADYEAIFETAHSFGNQAPAGVGVYGDRYGSLDVGLASTGSRGGAADRTAAAERTALLKR
jgi:hypothetical protein